MKPNPRALVFLALAAGCSHNTISPDGISITLSPQGSTVAAGGTQAFTATVTGNSDTAVVWSVQESGGGSIDGSGLYTAPSVAGTYHVVAAAHANAQATASAAVTVTPGISVAVSPHTAVVVTNGNASFTAAVTGTTDTAVTWTVAEGASGGTINPSGGYQAPATAGTYHVTATSHANSSRSDSATVTVSPPGVLITPASALVVTGGRQQFSAQIVGGSGSVNWSVQESGGGSVDSTGLYTPPAAAGTYHLIATSATDSSKTAVAITTVVATGQWYDVTPAGVSLDPAFVVSSQQDFNYGAQEVVVDPNNPGTALISLTYQGIWRTTDYGATWIRLGDGTGPMDNGRPAMSIAPDGSYILSTLLYPLNGFSNGAWKSEAPALGTSWRLITVPGVPDGDMGAFHIDPADKNHVIAQSHTYTGNFYESVDAGEHWTAQALPSGGGVAKLLLLETGTVIAGYDWSSGVNPQVGRRSGTTWPWTWSWSSTVTKTESGASSTGQTSFHADQQIFVDYDNKVGGNPVAYIGGPEGVHRSTDLGATWIKLSTPQNYSEGIVATPTTIYSTSSYANNTGFQNDFQHGPRSSTGSGSAWTSGTTPASMSNGWLAAGVAFDGTHYVLIAGCWNAGIFIYVEP